MARALVGSVGVAAALVILLAWSASGPRWPQRDGAVPEGEDGRTSGGKRSLLVFCAASQRPPLEAIAREYEKRYGATIAIQAGPSEAMLAALQVSREGDLFLPADASYLEMAVEKGLLRERFPLATMQAVLVVAKGNPKRLSSLESISAKGLRLAQGNPQSTAIGKLTREALLRSGAWERLAGSTTTFTGTVTDAANAVISGGVDAAIVWDALLFQNPTLERVEAAELADVKAEVAAGVLKSSMQPSEALRFARFLSAADQGLAEFKRMGYTPSGGDPWDEHPELTLYAGAMLRPAIDATITEFEDREGVRVNRVYNGCGVLVAQMQGGQMPDAYFACDKQFLTMVGERFRPGREISTNRLVILVRQGNPHGIASLADLAKSGLRVGIGHEKQCAMGALTQQTFRQTRVTEGVMKNVVVQAPTGDLLVNQLRAGDLDAAVAYLSNAAGHGDTLQAVAIDDLPCSIAVQPYAVARESKQRRLAERLAAALASAESERRFEANGFQWKAATDKP